MSQYILFFYCKHWFSWINIFICGKWTIQEKQIRSYSFIWIYGSLAYNEYSVALWLKIDLWNSHSIWLQVPVLVEKTADDLYVWGPAPHVADSTEVFRSSFDLSHHQPLQPLGSEPTSKFSLSLRLSHSLQLWFSNEWMNEYFKNKTRLISQNLWLKIDFENSFNCESYNLYHGNIHCHLLAAGTWPCHIQ